MKALVLSGAGCIGSSVGYPDLRDVVACAWTWHQTRPYGYADAPAFRAA